MQRRMLLGGDLGSTSDRRDRIPDALEVVP